MELKLVDDMMGTGPALCVPDLLPAFNLAEGIMHVPRADLRHIIHSLDNR